MLAFFDYMVSKKIGRLREKLAEVYRENQELEAKLATARAENKSMKKGLAGVMETIDLYAPRSLEYFASIPGLEIAGRVIPHNGEAGGDLAMPILFVAPEDMQKYTSSEPKSVIPITTGHSEMAMFIADSPGHDPLDGVASALVYNSARACIPYELKLNGEVTAGLVKTLTDVFYPGHVSPKGVTLLCAKFFVDKTDSGEIGRGTYVTAGHPHPRVFRHNEQSFDSKFDEKKAHHAAPIGYFPSNSEENDYAPNRFKLKSGDVALLYTDGFSDYGRKHRKCYFPQHAERILRDSNDLGAKDISNRFAEDIMTYSDRDDDITLFVVKKS